MSDAFDLVVLGGGPGGYTAAFRAADLGLTVALVEDRDRLGGVCLNVGCIPSKALLHAADVISTVTHATTIGLHFGAPTIDVDTLRTSTEKVVATLARGLGGLAKKRRIEVIHGTATFASPTQVTVTNGTDSRTLDFAHAIIAVGSRPIIPPAFPTDERIIDSTGALALAAVPDHLVIVGGGIIGLEMATVYRALGSQVTVVEMMDQLIPGCDGDLVKPLHARLTAAGVVVHLGTTVTDVVATPEALEMVLRSGDEDLPLRADRMLVAVGRRPNGDRIGAENAGVRADERGFVTVDDAMRTNVSHIFAIGDVIGNPMLAHKATHQGAVAAENAAGGNDVFDARTIPSVAYTDPEIAWAGLTETSAAQEGVAYELATIPWAASGRAMTLGHTDGRTKLLVEPGSHRILGVGIVGPNAGELIAEHVLAIEMGAVAEDIARSIHPHPTLSETGALAAEWAQGTITDLYRPPAPAATGSASA
ncbi:MAG TPA: dihydrolipoyl dehydrogenase [Miltoncostaeales bacterium]|nr:dihydrolipoyl dehydrogenase [Miltoncostaeales bacterium]